MMWPNFIAFTSLRYQTLIIIMKKDTTFSQMVYAPKQHTPCFQGAERGKQGKRVFPESWPTV